jgi:hypothetical protein
LPKTLRVASTLKWDREFESPFPEWVFVQKCLLERKCSYLTEKGLFSRKASPGSEEWIKTDEALDQIHRTMREFVPEERHKQRMSALHVSPVSVGLWNRPGGIAGAAHHPTARLEAGQNPLR